MNKILVLLFFISPPLNAQIQFWGKDDIIEKQFEAERKEMKIKTAYNYIVGSRWTINDSTKYNEVFHYDDKGRKTYYTKYKTDWASKGRRYKLLIDSITYTDNNVFNELIRCTPKGKKYYLTYKAKATHNKKGNIERINIYGGYLATELKKYDLYSYDKKDRVSKITAFNAKTKEKEYERLFEYDAKGNLTNYTFFIFMYGMNGKTEYKITYNNNGLVENYKELDKEAKEQNNAVYVYDSKNRITLRTYTTTTSYEDKFSCYYRGDETIPTGTRLDYSSGKGKRKQVRQNSLVYKFEYFD